MDEELSSLDDASVDVFEALKRAFIRRGFIRKNRLSAKSLAKPVKEKIKQHKLHGIAAKSHDILFKANTVFPFTLFPDTVILDREKLTIATRTFFRTAKINSIPIADIISVQADVGPFFGSVHVSSRNLSMSPNATPYSVDFLSRANTFRLQHLLQGYSIAHARDVDCANIEKDQLISLLNELGQGATE